MLQKIFGAVSIAAVAAAQETVSGACLSKTAVYGSSSVSGATNFDQTADVADLMPASFTPYEYDLCLDSSSRLVSFQFTYANEDGSDTFEMPRVGPAGDTCRSFPFKRRNFFDRAASFSLNDARIISLVLRHNPMEGEDNVNTQLGFYSTNTGSEVTEFGDNQELVGFHGSQTENGITSLGFITKWSDCSDSGSEGEVTFSSERKANNDEIMATVFIIVGVSIAVGILITLLCHFCAKNRSSKVGVFNGTEARDPSNTVNNSNSINAEVVPQDSEQDFIESGKTPHNKASERLPMQTTDI